MRLEPQLWRALEVIADREGVDVNALCSKVADEPRDEGGFTSALRVFIIRYFAGAAIGGEGAHDDSFMGGAAAAATTTPTRRRIAG